MSSTELPLVEPWKRVHVLSPLVRAGRGLIPLAFILFASLNNRQDDGGVFGHSIAIVIVFVVGFVYWLVTRWRVEDGTLRIETGLLRRSSLRFPLDQIQAIDVVRPGLARIFGLAELRLRMAGSTGKDGRLAYLKDHEAEVVRARLMALAHGVAEHTPAPPENILFRIPTHLVVASIVLSPFTICVAIGGIAIIATAVYVSTSVVLGVLGSAIVPLIAIAVGIFHRFNSAYNLTVAEAPDGLRLRSGLVEVTAETLPLSRIQGVRMVQPFLWRPFGWCRMSVDVAGRQRRKGENRAESGSGRYVVPIGNVGLAMWLLPRLLRDVPIERLRPPLRARWKSPLRYHSLSWGRTDTCAVTTSGRLARVTDWVPLGKIQSLRLVQGPVQRRLRLASLHLDTAGKNLHAELRDRDADDARAALEELTTKSRIARGNA